MKFFTEKRKGIFKIPTDEYDKHGGSWIDQDEVKIIIGETDDGYVTSILETSIPYWDEYGRYEAYMCIPLEIHKSRFVKWISLQTELFEVAITL